MATKTSDPATVNGITYKTEVTPTPDGGLKTTTLKSSTPTGTFAPVTSTITDKSGKTSKPSSDGFPSATASDRAAFANPTSPESKLRNTQVELSNPFGPNPNAQQKTVTNGAAGKPNAATVDSNQPTTPAATTVQADAAKAEAGSIKDGTRKSYNTDMRYPINLKSEVQDVIKFSILEYSPSLAKGNEKKGRIVTLEGGNPTVKGSKPIGVITLPIPAGISDSNPVGWQQDDINDLQKAFADAANIFLGGGSAEQAAKPPGELANDMTSPEGKAAVRGIFTGMAVRNQRIMTRTQGAILNNNAELLFSGPGLRSFSFTFSFYPREPKESIMVRQIIRAFKQAMSVKRSAVSILLKTPHTFAIQYMTAGQKAHPYLNRFKECALTSCSVDYTPDGTYMTYGGAEKSMTAYRLGLTFQELEPLFDDEYGQKDDNIGF